VPVSPSTNERELPVAERTDVIAWLARASRSDLRRAQRGRIRPKRARLRRLAQLGTAAAHEPRGRQAPRGSPGPWTTNSSHRAEPLVVFAARHIALFPSSEGPERSSWSDFRTPPLPPVGPRQDPDATSFRSATSRTPDGPQLKSCAPTTSRPTRAITAHPAPEKPSHSPRAEASEPRGAMQRQGRGQACTPHRHPHQGATRSPAVTCWRRNTIDGRTMARLIHLAKRPGL